jgi:two-component system, OmpR family, sensor histidine kinase KdpD
MVDERSRGQDKRPSPEALLAEARRGAQGRLKIFLGAAPGVGKTYEMLTSGRAKQRDGVDVVIGVVETHGRKETEALLDGLEVIPRRLIPYKGQTLEEMDLDALLARRPRLALVDELAHTNAPESRHSKRWQDVEDLLAAGIDVYTTLNIQHVESLNDIVAQITRIRVRETVPDSMIDRADDIELTDLTPDDLMARLKEGKVYVPQTAERALGHYFSPGNLTALRELALRRTAQRVDDQLLTHMQAHAIAGPWAAGERVLVCVSEDPRSAGLVRYAKRLADRLRAPWTALTVESRRSASLSEEQRDRIADTLRLAERLGGEAVTVPGGGRRIADDVIGYAQDNNVTHIVIGKSSRSRWFEMLHGSVVHDLVRRAGNISVHVIAGEDVAAEPASRQTARSAPALRRADGVPFLVAILAVAVALGVAKLVQPFLGVGAVDLVLLTAVVAIAIQYGLHASLLAVVVASLSYNFFFLPPLHTFTIADPTNVASLALFTIVAVLVSNLAARVRLQAAIARTRAKTTESLYGFSRKLTTCTGLDDVLWATAFQMASLLNARIVLLLPDTDGRIEVRAGFPPEDMLDPADIAAAKVAHDTGRPAGRGADTLPGAKRLFLPMRTNRGVIGVVGLDSDKPGPILTPDQRRLFDALSDQAALAIQQVQLLEDLDRAKLNAETDRLRQALLTSISHDLRTPLATIMGSAGTLRDYNAELDKETKGELLGSIQDESERLNRFIANLLDMTRLESGAVAPNRSPHEVGEVVGAALKRAATVLADHRVEVELSPDLPMVDVDPVLFEQVLFNLLDNAAKYAPLHTTVRLQGWHNAGEGSVCLQILDEGDGIPPEDVERIFDKFHRAAKGDRVRAGTGLGLAVCRGFVEAMGGTIRAGNRTDRSGAVFTIALPAAAEPKVEAAA